MFKANLRQHNYFYHTQDYTYSNIQLLTKNNVQLSQPVFTSSKLTIETVEQGVKYVQSKQ